MKHIHDFHDNSIIVIDEAQFFDNLYPFINLVFEQKKNIFVIISGLDYNFKKQIFKPDNIPYICDNISNIQQQFNISYSVKYLTTQCQIFTCEGIAKYTHYMIEWDENTPTIKPGEIIFNDNTSDTNTSDTNTSDTNTSDTNTFDTNFYKTVCHECYQKLNHKTS